MNMVWPLSFNQATGCLDRLAVDILKVDCPWWQRTFRVAFANWQQLDINIFEHVLHPIHVVGLISIDS